MELTPIVELGVAEAYEILVRLFRAQGLPPLDAIENEDWGRDFLLSKFQDFSAAELAAAGLTWADGAGAGAGRTSAPDLAPGS